MPDYVGPPWKILAAYERFIPGSGVRGARGALAFSGKTLFHAGEPLPADYQFSLRLPFEERIVTGGPDPIHGLIVKPPVSRGLLLYFHGNAGNLEDWGVVAEDLASRVGLDVWVIDYPGFGKSGGTITSEERLHQDADAIFAAARKEAGARPLVIMGRSVGTGLAVRLAALNPVSALVLESPYYSMTRLAKQRFPWVPGFLLRYNLNSFNWIPLVKAPALLLHGKLDELIPYAEGKALAALLPAARLVTIERGHHNDLSEFPNYWKELESFLRSLPHVETPLKHR